MTDTLTQERIAALKRLEAPPWRSFHLADSLHQALIHKSYANEQGLSGYHNERLEFLGDAVLELVISEHIYRCFPSAPEGGLARLRSVVVSEHTLAKKAGISSWETIFWSAGERLKPAAATWIHCLVMLGSGHRRHVFGIGLPGLPGFYLAALGNDVEAYLAEQRLYRSQERPAGKCSSIVPIRSCLRCLP